MADPFIAEIRLFSFNLVPKGWAKTNGQILPIAQNTALFSLIGTFYGGNGQTNFALPDLRGCVPLHSGGGYTLGQRGGEQNHTLLVAEIPNHTHQLHASSNNATATALTDTFYPAVAETNIYASGAPNTMMKADTSIQGSSQPHNNMQPFLTLNFCIALQGVFPPRD